MSDCKNGHVDPPRYSNGGCKPCQYEHNAKNARINGPARRARVRMRALAAYGGKCVCCGEDREPFLVLDHINDDGARHREIVRPSPHRNGAGHYTYRWLEREGYPPIVQVLCANCNMAKTRGICPHKETE